MIKVSAYRVSNSASVCVCVCARAHARTRVYFLVCTHLCVFRVVLAKNEKHARISVGLWNLR